MSTVTGDDDDDNGCGGEGRRRERDETVEQPPQWRSRSAWSEWDAHSSWPSADGGVTLTVVASLSRGHLCFTVVLGEDLGVGGRELSRRGCLLGGDFRPEGHCAHVGTRLDRMSALDNVASMG